MYGDHGPVLDALRARGTNPAMLEAALRTVAESGRSLGEVLVDQGAVTEIELADATADAYGITSVDLTNYPMDVSAAARIPLALARRHRVLGIS